MEKIYKTVVAGAGAAGLVCAAYLISNGVDDILIIEKNNEPAAKLRITGGGKANFTNTDITFRNYLCSNNHFIKSALSRYDHYELMSRIYKAGIEIEEREHGRIFCKKSASDLINLLTNITKKVKTVYSCELISVVKADGYFILNTSHGTVAAENVVIATGSSAAPYLGASETGMHIAKQFGHKIIPVRPGLVPLKTELFKALAGISLPVVIAYDDKKFNDALLFTHTGISGPAVLQISSYWRKGEEIKINFLPKGNVFDIINNPDYGKMNLVNRLSMVLPSRLLKLLLDEDIGTLKCASAPKHARQYVYDRIHNFSFIPTGTDLFKKAEVMLGGVDTTEISSKDMQSKICKGLYFAGEVMDVTGELGGYNLHWAYASGMSVASGILADLS